MGISDLLQGCSDKTDTVKITAFDFVTVLLL